VTGIFISLLAWSALILQFPLSLTASRANGQSILAAVITYFSFFTILTNILAALSLTASLWSPNSKLGKFFSRPEIITGIAINITLVGISYSLLLRSLWNPEGFQKLADIALHDLIPVLYIAYWLLFVPKSTLRWRHIPLWMTYPLAYFSYALIRGALTARYPYHFIDAASLGYPRVVLNATIVLIAFLVVSLAVVAASRRTTHH
jgi:hypothetical protein